MEDTGIVHRKAEQIEIISREDVSSSLTTGLEEYAFQHWAVPELNLDEIDLSTAFLGKNIRLPLLISCMTGGTPEAETINTRLAVAAEKYRIALGIGSERALLEDPTLLPTYAVRKVAPDIPFLANLGAVQLNYGFGVDECKKAVELIQADALVLHLNPLQEALQPEGNHNWSGLLAKIEQVIRQIHVPVIIKEVGWGISAQLVKQFTEMGAYAVDLAGAGGTSWSQVELYRLKDPSMREIASHFRSWGIPTARAILAARREAPDALLIASGGITNGMELCKAIGLGADLGGIAGIFLKAAIHSQEAVEQKIAETELEMKITLFSAGIASVPALRGTHLLQKVNA